MHFSKASPYPLHIFFALIRSTYGQDMERIGRDPVGKYRGRIERVRYCDNLGFISKDRTGDEKYGHSTTIIKTDLLDMLFKFTKYNLNQHP